MQRYQVAPQANVINHYIDRFVDTGSIDDAVALFTSLQETLAITDPISFPLSLNSSNTGPVTMARQYAVSSDLKISHYQFAAVGELFKVEYLITEGGNPTWFSHEFDVIDGRLTSVSSYEQAEVDPYVQHEF